MIETKKQAETGKAMSIVERKNNVLPRITDSILIKLLLAKKTQKWRESASERESEKENQSPSFIVINCGMWSRDVSEVREMDRDEE